MVKTRRTQTKEKGSDKDQEQQHEQEDQPPPLTTTTSSSSTTTPFTFQGVSYNTYEEMVHAKRAYNQQVLEKSGLLEASANFHEESNKKRRSSPSSSLLSLGLRSDRKRKDTSKILPALRRKSSRIAGMESDGMYIEDERLGGKVIVVGGGGTQEKKNVIHVENDDKGGGGGGGERYYNNRVNDGSDLSIQDAVELTGSKWVRESSVGNAQEFVTNTLSKMRIQEVTEDASKHDDGVGVHHEENVLVSQVKKLSVDRHEETGACVAKVVPDRIYSVAFHPSDSKLLATAGDKSGFLGIWDVDSRQLMDDDGHGGGVHLFKPHVGAINNLEWNKSGSKLLSMSYDGTIRMLDVQREVFEEVFAAYDSSDEYREKLGYGMDEGNKFYTQYACLDPRHEECIFLSTSVGGVVHMDLRSKAKLTFDLTLSEKKINSLSLHPNGYTLASAGLDCSVNLWDVRNLAGLKKGAKLKPFATQRSAKSINSAFFSPSGKHMLTTTMSNTLDILSDFHLEVDLVKTPTHRIRHDNQTGRWLSTFMAQWHPTATKEDLFVVGSMAKPRRMEFFNSDGNMIRGLEGEALTAVVSRCCFHPSTEHLIALGGNSSGRVTIAR